MLEINKQASKFAFLHFMALIFCILIDEFLHPDVIIKINVLPYTQPALYFLEDNVCFAFETVIHTYRPYFIVFFFFWKTS